MTTPLLRSPLLAALVVAAVGCAEPVAPPDPVETTPAASTPTTSATASTTTDTGTAPPMWTTTMTPNSSWPVASCMDLVVPTGNAEGDVADNFTLTDQHGTTVQLHQFCDRFVLLISAAFW